MCEGERPKIVIRKARKEELPKLAEIYLSAYEGMEHYAYYDYEEALDYMEWLYRGHKDGFFVAEVNGEPVGFVACNPFWRDRFVGRTCEIHEVAVAKGWKGKGIGRMLMQRALEYGREKGCRTASLWVGEGNTLAIEWYRRLGFKRAGRWGVWIRMRKNLSEGQPEGKREGGLVESPGQRP